ncbi:MAG: hypothetical protein KBD00_00245 [Candidatus Peribacteraceae bacterium]|nr:hypothetical protein [Candidatus Peribacteraceae bacterium]
MTSVVSVLHAEEIDTAVTVEDGQKKAVNPCEKEQKSFDAAQKAVKAAEEAMNKARKENDTLRKLVDEALTNLTKGDPAKLEERVKELERMSADLSKSSEALSAAIDAWFNAEIAFNAADDALHDCLEKNMPKPMPKGPIALDTSIEDATSLDIVAY